MNDVERKLRQLYGIKVERVDSGSPLFQLIVRIPWDAEVGLKGWSMIDSLIHDGEKGKRRSIGTWIRTRD